MPLSFFQRLGLAWSSWWRTLTDPDHAARLLALDAPPALPPAPPPAPPAPPPVSPPGAAGERERWATGGALELLGLLQREARLVDFLQQDIASFDDVDVGVAARVVHAGGRRALAQLGRLEPVRPEPEGAPLRVDCAGPELKLVGAVHGAGPYSGVLRHAGWRFRSLTPLLPAEGEDAAAALVVAPAEVEL